MPTGRPPGAVEAAWAEQQLWSQAADRLKQGIDRARLAALLLAVATAVLAAAASQLSDPAPTVGRVLTAAAAVTAGLATLVQRRVSLDQVRAWTRARSASEGLKSEVYSALADGEADDPERDRALAVRTREIVGLVEDLRRHTLGLASDDKPVPAVHDVDSYIAVRLDQQIENYYTPKAETYERRVRRLRTLGTVLGVAAVVLAGLGSAFDLAGLALWVPVVTTVATSLAAHVGAARYDHLVIEYLRTARRLTDLRDDHRRTPGATTSSFVESCEAAISVENQAWMARWNQAEGTGS